MSQIRARYNGDMFTLRPNIVRRNGVSIPMKQNFRRNGAQEDIDTWEPGTRFEIGVVEPNAGNTGVPADTVLTPRIGDVTITTAGTVLDKLDISGRVYVRAPNVTIKNCRIRSQDRGTTWGAVINGHHPSATGLLVEFCDIAQSTASAWFWTDGIVGHSFTARYNHIHDVVDYFGTQSNSTKPGLAIEIAGNYCDVMSYFEDPSEPHGDHRSHNDSNQIQGSPANKPSSLLMDGNSLHNKVSPLTSNHTSPYGQNVTGQVITGTPQPENGPNRGVVITRNWLYGGSRHIIIASNVSIGVAVSNFGSITNNRLDNSANVAPRIQVDNNLTIIVSGNTRMDTGATVNATFVTPGSG